MHYEDILVNEEVKFRENKRKILKDGFYSLYVCDFEKGSRGLLKAQGLPDGKSVCIARCINGIVYEFFTGKNLEFVDDVDVIYDISEEFYYFEKPCYVNYKKLGLGDIAAILNSYEDVGNIAVLTYIKVLEEQYIQAVSGYQQMRNSIEKHKKQLNKKM